ncbi:hypothetical protein G8A07_08380 [Roseateles sp. DAIF2]|uniref:DUF6683 family protein n=1 Tax=Roseateles sp. DAIF2 TaxID=2714952 RepID=UPI0018A327F6|nr:DUF6683 family protein [Roseateles sp. DAIF2]QPF72944.1 hypothetical protein G8A07_08380 [Roseateles sp. DAIF2]
MKLLPSWRRHAPLLGTALWIATTPALAFDIPPPPPPLYQGLILPLFPNGTTIPFSGQSGSLSTTDKRRAEPPGATLANGQAQPETHARELAQLVPPAHREQMAQAYLQAFNGYRQLERKLGLENNDLAGSIAAFIAGNYMALNNVDLPDPHFQKLAAQLRQSLPRNPGYTQLSVASKRKLYEQTAMVGTFMAVARLSFQQKPNPAAERHYRESARANLELVLQTPAEQVRIDAQGLHLGPQGR